MANLYFSETLIAKTDVPGVLSNQLINEEIVITYPHKKNKYYTVLIYDQNNIHSLIINIKGDQMEKGDVLVEYEPFKHKPHNYIAVIYIYEQVNKIPLTILQDEFDMEKFILEHQLTLLYTIEFTILQKFCNDYCRYD